MKQHKPVECDLCIFFYPLKLENPLKFDSPVISEASCILKIPVVFHTDRHVPNPFFSFTYMRFCEFYVPMLPKGAYDGLFPLEKSRLEYLESNKIWRGSNYAHLDKLWKYQVKSNPRINPYAPPHSGITSV